MPLICTFYGIIIQMYWDDPAPPHFHAEYAGYKIAIDIRTLETLKGRLLRRALALLLEWAQEHRAELMENWKLCQLEQSPNKISPDGVEGEVDMSQRVHSPRAGVFRVLADLDLFAQAYIEHGAVTWPGELDLAPDAMHDEIKKNGVWILK